MRTWIALLAGLLICLAGCAAFKEFVGGGGVEQTGEAVSAAGDVAALFHPAIGAIVKTVGLGLTSAAPAIKEGIK